MRIPGHPSLYGEWEDTGEDPGAMAMGIWRPVLEAKQSQVHTWENRCRFHSKGTRVGSHSEVLGGPDRESTSGHFREQKRLGWVGRPAEETLSLKGPKEGLQHTDLELGSHGQGRAGFGDAPSVCTFRMDEGGGKSVRRGLSRG